MKLMKICVFSDSHGHSGRMIAAIAREKPTLCFFLGDGERDVAAVRERFCDLPFYAVRGNCDLRSTLPRILVCAVGGVKVLATHGHLYNVKYDQDLTAIEAAAREAGAAVALFGHTHRPYLERRGDVLLLNPGAIGDRESPGYGLLEMGEGYVTAIAKTIENK